MNTIYWVTETPTGDSDYPGKYPVVPIFFRTLEDQQTYLREVIEECNGRVLSREPITTHIIHARLSYSQLLAGANEVSNIPPSWSR
jgi:hypothetical protein